MPQYLVITLILVALVLPLAGATVLRILGPRLTQLQAAVAGALLFVAAAGSVLTLARGEIAQVEVAGLTVLVPIGRPGDADPIIPPDVLVAPDPDGADDMDHGNHGSGDPATMETTEPAVTVTLEATDEPIPEPTPEPSVTAEPTPEPTPEPSVTAEPTPEPTSEPTPEPTATVEPTSAGPQRYTVQAGDTLGGIASRFGVSVADLLRANDLTAQEADTIRPGQELVIP